MIRFQELPLRFAVRGVTGLRAGWGAVAICLALAASGGALVGATTAARGEEGLPQAEALIQKMIDANGGAAAYSQMKSRFSSGRMSLPKMGIDLSLQAWAERPNRSYVVMESAALGKSENGCDGVTVWENSAMLGPSIKRGAERAVQLREADFDNWINWRRYYKSATTAGADTVNGRAAWKIEMVPVEGLPETMWVDQATGLSVKNAMTMQTEMGDVPVETFLEDYREVCGVKMPFRLRQVMMGGMQEMITTTDSMACNPPVPEGRFALPTEIQTLLEKSKSADTPAATEPAKETPAEKGEGKK